MTDTIFFYYSDFLTNNISLINEKNNATIVYNYETNTPIGYAYYTSTSLNNTINKNSIITIIFNSNISQYFSNLKFNYKYDQSIEKSYSSVKILQCSGNNNCSTNNLDYNLSTNDKFIYAKLKLK